MLSEIEKLCRGTGWYVSESAHDTTNVPCKRGHIYWDGRGFVAAINGADLAEMRALKKLGEPVMDGDFGELSVRFPKSAIREVAKIMKPLQRKA